MADQASNTRAAEAACVEDYNDESETAVLETRKTANITAKRSKPDVTKLQVARDEISDSGHSSQTRATLESTNSSLESKSGSDTIRAESHAVADKLRPTKVEEKPHGKSKSLEKSLPQKVASRSGKQGIARKGPCNCNKCVTKARRSTPHHSSKPIGKARATGPETLRQPPVQVLKEAPIPQYAPSQPRALTSLSYHRERPLSLYAGTAPELFYSQPIEPRPTVKYAHIASIPPPSYPPHPTSYFPPPQPIQHPQQFYTSPPSPYESQAQPRPREWTSDYHRPPRPQSMVYTNAPIIEYVADSVYAPVSPPAQPPSRQSSHRERPRALPEQRPASDEDYYNMPPPAPPPPSRSKSTSHQDRRPAIRHTANGDTHPTYTHRRTVRDESTTAHVGYEIPVKQSYAAQERAGRTPRSTSDETITNTRGVECRMTRTSIESDAAKHRRRASVYGYESSNELADEVEAAEAYQASKGNGRTSNHIPTHPSPLVRKKTHTNSKSSETSSRKSGKSGKSRTSRTSKTSRDGNDLRYRRPSEDDEFSMRVDTSHGVNVDLKGGMEGRRITVRQNKDEGEMEFSIGCQERTTMGARRESREKSRRRYPYRDGRSETEIDRTRIMSRPPMKIREKEEVDEKEPRIVRERITTRTKSLRGSSRVRGERVGFV